MSGLTSHDVAGKYSTYIDYCMLHCVNSKSSVVARRNVNTMKLSCRNEVHGDSAQPDVGASLGHLRIAPCMRLQGADEEGQRHLASRS